LKLIAEMMRSYSQILKAVAEIEEMRNRAPPNLYAVFAVALFRLTAAAPKLQNPLTLTTEEKKKLSNEILELAEIMAKIAASKQ